MSTIDAYTGPFGLAVCVPVPDLPSAAETLAWWLVDAPKWAPLLVPFRQWVIAVVRLRDDVPGFPPPTRKFDGATHEVLVLTLDPDHPATPEQMVQPGYRSRHLTPVNVAEQFEATDDEMAEVVELCACAVVDGVMCPEAYSTPSGSARQLSADWLTAITKTLAHIRGEEHAR